MGGNGKSQTINPTGAYTVPTPGNKHDKRIHLDDHRMVLSAKGGWNPWGFEAGLH
jgi:hypothetical protein